MRVFVSSVVAGFESFREAAIQAVSLLKMDAVNSEAFAARTYSSETACLMEVERSDLVLLVMGEKYGSLTDDGISITQSEYRHARKCSKPVLVFIQKVEMEEKQEEFRKEVEHYVTGLFRKEFETPEKLKDQVIEALREVETQRDAIPIDQFVKLVHERMKEVDRYGSKNDPRLVVAFLPQPGRHVDVVELEEHLDPRFDELCRMKVMRKRDGYEEDSTGNRTGIRSKETKSQAYWFTDGMVVVLHDLKDHDDQSLAARYIVPPSTLKSIAAEMDGLCDSRSALTYLGLCGMEYAYVKDFPSDKNRIGMRMSGDTEAGHAQFLAPFDSGSYRTFVDRGVKLFIRSFKG